MRFPWESPLRAGMIANPMVEVKDLGLLEGIRIPDTKTLGEIFPGDGHQLKTWGRTPGKLEIDAHWIGVRKGTPLHTDFKYPRYSHQIILRADGMFLRGYDRVETKIRRGIFFILDTHSPHQLCVNPRKPGMPAPWYVAVSMDTKEKEFPSDKSIPILMEYARTAQLAK